RNHRELGIAAATRLPGSRHGSPHALQKSHRRPVPALCRATGEAFNHALANAPADRVRLHICWGNYEGSHIHDMDCMKIFPITLKAKPMALLVEAAHPHHEHKWDACT